MTKNTISITLEGALNALAKSKDGNHVAVAGRTVFKILQINDEEAKFVELMNMRVGKNLNLNSSCNDVVWSHLDPNILATGATNGAVVIWRMDKSSRSKMDYVYTDHKRTVNKVCFHPNEPNLLISGSQDGRMNLFDLRQKDKAASTFLSQSESVRDVQFSRFRDNVFSSVQENGNVQIWNLRKTSDHYSVQFTAHSGPVFCCDWHLEDQRYLATAGRDKTIKIWEISSNKPQLEHCITSVASVARIKWRPHQFTHIASSSLVVDFNIYLWDYLRPFVPFANIQEHKDVSTDFIWRDTNANILISVGKDGTVYQHTVGEVDNWLKANPCALNLNNSGDIFLATSNYLIKEISPSNIINYLNTGKDPMLNGLKENSGIFSSDKSNSKNLNFSLSTNLDHFNSQQTSKDSINTQQNISSSLTTTPSSAVTLIRRGMEMIKPHQSISSQSNAQNTQQHNNQQTNQQLNAQQANLMKNIFTSSAAYFKNKNVCKSISMDWFCKTALNYQLTGKPMNDLFEHNATVAENLDRPQIAQTWRILKQLYIGTSNWNQSSALKQQNLSNSSITNNSPLINSTLLSTSSSADTSSINKQQQSSIGTGTNQLIGNNLSINDSNKNSMIINFDKTSNDLKTRNNSGQQNSNNRQSRQANGNAASIPGMSMMINIPQKQQQYQQNSSNIVPSSSVNESSTLASRSNQFGTTRNRLATYSGSSRLPITNTTPILPLNLTQSNKNLTSPAVATNKNDSDNDESDEEEINEQQRYQPIPFTPIDKEHQAADFFFGDGDVNETHGLTSYDGLANNDMITELDDIALNLTEVQREAFQLKHEIPDFTVPPDLDLINNDLNAINLVDETETIEDDYTTNQANSKKLIKDQNVDRILSVEAETNSPFKFSDIVVEMLRFYANQGDVQTTVSVCIILGKQISHAIDIATQEHWFHSYIDLLSRFQLWNIINQVSNLSVLPSINSLNQISTTIYTSCANCNKPINQNKTGWFCKCKNFSKCSVCHQVVKGIYVWCKTCTHGGHINHLKDWFENNKLCPTGCAHMCELY